MRICIEHSLSRVALLACLLLLFSCTAFCQWASSGSQPPPSSADLANPALAEAKSLLRQGKVNEADRAVRQFLAAQPESAEGHFLLGHILFREIQSEARLETQLEGVQVLGAGASPAKHGEENARASLAEFTAGAKFHDPSAADLKVVAFDYVLLGDYVDADKWLTKMLSWTPSDADGWYLLGRTKYNENRFAEAVNAFRRCLRLAPNNVKAGGQSGIIICRAWSQGGSGDGVRASHSLAVGVGLKESRTVYRFQGSSPGRESQ